MRSIRLRGFLILGFVLASLTAQANGMTVSSFACHLQVPCDPANPLFPPLQTFLTNATACLSRYVTPVPDTPVFDGAGFDPSGCLVTNPAAFPATGLAPTIPHCCLTRTQGDSCIMQCSIDTQ